MMISLPRHVRNLVRSSIIVPSKPLQGLSIHVPSSVVRPGKFSCNTNHTAQLVTGLDLVQFYHSSDINLQHPDYADEGTRLQSFKHWCGPVPATELADAGLYMVDYDTVKCYSCRVVIQGWKKGDKPIDMHCLHNSNCDFVKKYIQKLNEIHDICTDPRDIAGRPNERPVVKKRIKDNSYSSSTKPLSTVRDIKYPKVTYQTPAVHPVSQQSLSIHGHLLKGSTTKTSDDVMYTLPSEKIIVSEQRQGHEEEYCLTDDNQPIILPILACKICQDKNVECVFLPCGDAKTCSSCATRLFNSGLPCYFCSRPVATVHPVFL